MSDISNAAQNTPRRDDEATPAAPGPPVANHAVVGKGRFVAAAAAAVALGVAWIAFRVAKASAKRHPAVRVTRAGIHAVRDR